MAPHATATVPAAPAEYFAQIALDVIVASPTNPRTHFPGAYLEELAQSIKEKGLVQPIVVRERASSRGPRFEIVAGECRYRASKLAGLATMSAIVREYSDEQVLEVQLIENIHRTDLTPLEQAAGYRRLIASNPTKHSAESIAQRIGMSPAWVWDRLKLNDLVPEAKVILEHAWMSVGHAILIARLKPADQTRAIAIDDESARGGGLWRTDHGFDFDETHPATKGQRRPTKYEEYKTCSVRELEHWIRDHVRFDVAHAAKAQPLTFDATAARVDEAEAKPGRGKKVIAITLEGYLQPEARDGEERTYGPRSFKFADGNEHVDGYPRRKYIAKPCEHAVLGVVAAGERYGATIDVCIARDKCQVHWKQEQTARAKSSSGAGAKQKAAAARARQEAQWKREREAEEAERKAWKTDTPAALTAFREHVKAITPTAAFLGGLPPSDRKTLEQLLGAPITAATLGAAIALDDIQRCMWSREEFVAAAKVYGFKLPARKAAAPATKKASTR